MATSYTSLLGLALPVTGELAGTWGDTVNNAITSLLDTAVAGTTTLSTDADVTLTTTAGVTNQARQAILLCSGARTALRTITAPAQSKIYVVINNTTGGFGVKLVGAGPTTGITVAAGKTAVLVWNGSDFVEVAPATATTATNLAGGAAGSVPYQTGSGATTFLSLGTAAQVLQVNAGATAPEWVSSTGTGNVVRATSPTIATPTFTTSATFPLHIGGTGTTSTLTMRSTSGVGTTGADIIFQTGNNGATEAMRILNSGNVGIGTASPVARLDIQGTGAVAAVLNQRTDTTSLSTPLMFKTAGFNYWAMRQASGALTWYQDTAVGGTTTEYMRISSTGDVGIGTTSPTATLDVRGTMYVIGAGGTRVTDTSAGNGFEVVPSTTTNVLSYNRTTLAYLPIRWRAGVQSWEVDNVERMRIDSSGRVLIGQTASRGTVSAKLQVDDSRISITAGGASGIIGGIAPASSVSNSITIEADPDNVAASSFVSFNVDATERMRINSIGNVGIGTASPTSPLTVYAANNQAALRVTNGPSANNVGITLESTGGNVVLNNGNGPFELSTGGSIRAVVTAAGNLGIGTVAPTSPLTIGTPTSSPLLINGQTTGASYISITNTSGTYVAGLNNSAGTAIGSGLAYSALVGSNSATALQLTTNGNARLTIDSTGLVGIGTAAPSQLLHIASGDATALIENTAATSNATLQLKYPSRTWALANRGSDLSGAFAVRDVTASADRLIITSAGNVGIGTNAPTQKLHVVGGTVTDLSGTASATAVVVAPTANSNFFTIKALAGNSAGLRLSAAAADDVASITNFYNAALTFGTNNTERMRIDSAGNVGIGTTSPVNKLQVNGSFGRNAPVTKTGNFTLADTENWLICNGTATITVTLPAASSWTGREVMIKTIAAFTVVSASSNVVPLAGGAAGTAILAATAGKFATLVSDGTNWIIMQAN